MLAALDPSIADLMSNARPEKLLTNNGIIKTQIIRSVAVSQPETAVTNAAFDTGTKLFTLKSFLSANATLATNSRDGIDYCSSNSSTTCAVQSISVPIMIAAMGGYQFIHDDEMIFEKSASKDKDYVVIEGALHGFGPCTACEKTKGQYSNTVKNLFDYIGGRRRGTEANPRNKDDRGRRSARSYQSIRKKHQEGKCEVEEYGLGQEPEW